MNQEHIDYVAERTGFILRKPSRRTQGAYNRALLVFEEWLQQRHFALTAVTPALAADFIRDLRVGKRKGMPVSARPLTEYAVRAVVTACSSFYTYLGRRFPEVRNPFRGAPAVRSELAREEKKPAL